MLLEISEQEKILKEQNILSTIIIFGGANLSEKATIDGKLLSEKNSLRKDPSSTNLIRAITKLKNLKSISHYYDSAREFAKIVSR